MHTMLNKDPSILYATYILGSATDVTLVFDTYSMRGLN